MWPLVAMFWLKLVKKVIVQKWNRKPWGLGIEMIYVVPIRSLKKKKGIQENMPFWEPENNDIELQTYFLVE